MLKNENLYLYTFITLIFFFIPSQQKYASDTNSNSLGSLKKKLNKTRDMDILLKKNSSYSLNKNIQITFLAHSHKKTTSEDPKSPLVTHIRYVETDLREESNELRSHTTKKIEKHYNLFLDPGNKLKSGWVWRKFVFILLDYEYDEFIKLRIYPLENYNILDNNFIIEDDFQ